MSPLAQESMLGLAMRFDVVVDGIDLGGWATCQGLAVSFGAESWPEGGTNDYIPILPGQVKYDPIKLTRAMSAAQTGSVMAWLAKKVVDFSPGTAQITLRDAKGGEVASWSLRNVYPSKWTGPGLDAGASKIALETLELMHEGFL
jgi:phage tail-like protein